MKEYDKIIEKYSFGFYSIFSNDKFDDWFNLEQTEVFLEKYWLSEKEYQAKWKKIQDIIFINQEKGLPDLLFNNSYDIGAIIGGAVFENSDFKKLKNV
jgi:hypothetical protein